MKKPVLSICIPTYNNADTLCRTLGHITSDNYFMESEDVEIVVSDDCSTDHTERVARSFESRLPGIVRYRRTPFRLGYNNAYHALQEANGEYLKLLKDSSSIRPACLEPWTNIVKRLASSRPVFFLINEAPQEHESSITHCEGLEEFLAVVSYRCADIEGFGIWREDLAAIAELQRDVKCNLAYADALLRVLQRKPRSLILRESILDVEPVGSDLYVNVAEDYGFSYLGVLEPYVASGELSKFLYEEQKKRVLLECIMPLVSGRPQCLELNSLSAFLQYYTNEDYFPPSLTQVMRDLSAPKVVISNLATRSSSVSSTPADGLVGQEYDQYTGAKPYILSNDVPRKKFVFYTPHYDDNSGGSIAIFKMAHLLNQTGHDARIWHWTRLHANEVRVINGKITKEFLIPSGISRVDIDCPYPIVEATPEDVSDSIVVYPEVIEGNPLGARRVVRWLLNKPGAITGVTSFGFDDLILYYNDQFLPNGVVANEEFRIKVTDMKTHIYRDDYAGERKGIYFMVRKGRDVPLNYHPKDAIQVDGLSHAELARIFSTAKMFISYDLYTAYSIYASLCGCDSVLVPRRGMSREQWKSNGNHSHLDGIAYGFEDIERARRTRGKMIARIEAGNSDNMLAVEKFVRACRLLN